MRKKIDKIILLYGTGISMYNYGMYVHWYGQLEETNVFFIQSAYDNFFARNSKPAGYLTSNAGPFQGDPDDSEF